MKTTNKIRYAHGILVAIVAAMTLSCLILSCAQPDGSTQVGGSTGKGAVVLTVSTGNDAATESGAGPALRTIYPKDKPTFSKYEVVFTNEEGETPEVEPEEDGHTYYLETGTWTVKVSAYQKFTLTGGTETEYKAAEGSAEVEIGEWTIAPVTVALYPIEIAADAPSGIFSYKVSYPSGVTGTLKLDNEEVVDLAGNSTSAAGSVAKTPGYYKLYISLSKDNGKFSAGLSEAVHIYSGFESEAEFTFTSEDFTTTVYLGGTITLPTGVSVDSSKTNKIEGYTSSDYNDETPISLANLKFDGAGEESSWIGTIPAAELVEGPLYLKAVVTDGSKIYIGTGGTGSSITEYGKLDIELSDETDPAAVTDLTAKAGNKQVTLAWEDPKDQDLDHIEITWTSGGTGAAAPVEVSPGVKTYTATGLTNGTDYTFTVKTVDTAAEPNSSAAEPVGATPVIGWTAIADGESATLTSKKITFTFDEAVSDLKGSNININSSTSSLSPEKAGEPDDGTVWILTYSVTNQGSINVSISGKNDIASDTKPVTVYKDSTAPNNVTGLEAEPGSKQVTLTWADPEDEDFDHIEITYTYSGGSTQAVTPNIAKGEQKAVIGELTNGTTYTFTVNAVDKENNKNAGTQIQATPADSTGTLTVSAFNELINSATGSEFIIDEVAITGTTGTIDFDSLNVTVLNSFSVPQGVTLKVGTGGLTVNEDAEFDIAGTLNVAGTITVDGTLTIKSGATTNVPNTGTITVNGTLTIENGVSGDLKGTINVQSGGSLYDLKTGGGSLWAGSSNGKYVYYYGSEGYAGGTSTDNPWIGPAVSNPTQIQLANGQLSVFKASYTLNGDAAITGNLTLSGKFNVASGKKLTVDLVNAGNAEAPDDYPSSGLYVLNTSSFSGVSTASIEIVKGNTNGGLIYIAKSNTTGSNFYDADGKKLEAAGVSEYIEVPVGVYEWVSDADGQTDGDQAGWKEHLTGGIVKVTFVNVEDEQINLNKPEDTLSWAANTKLTVNVQASETYTYQWALDGEELDGETNNSLTLYAGALAPKKHSLTVIVTKGGVKYTKRLTFTVKE